MSTHSISLGGGARLGGNNATFMLRMMQTLNRVDVLAVSKYVTLLLICRNASDFIIFMLVLLLQAMAHQVRCLALSQDTWKSCMCIL